MGLIEFLFWVVIGAIIIGVVALIYLALSDLGP